MVGYFGVFCVSKILTKNAHFFDKFLDLLWLDVIFDPDGGSTIEVKGSPTPATKGSDFCR